MINHEYRQWNVNTLLLGSRCRLHDSYHLIFLPFRTKNYRVDSTTWLGPGQIETWIHRKVEFGDWEFERQRKSVLVGLILFLCPGRLTDTSQILFLLKFKWGSKGQTLWCCFHHRKTRHRTPFSFLHATPVLLSLLQTRTCTTKLYASLVNPPYTLRPWTSFSDLI